MAEDITLNVGRSGPVQSAHADMLLDVMDDLEYRRITSPEDLEAVGRLRQKAFDKYDIYVDKFGKEVIEEIDSDPLTRVFGVYFRGELASTIRTKCVTAESRECGAIKLFGSVINSMLDQGMTLVDPGRLAIDQDLSKSVPGLNIITTRLAIIAALHYNVDYLLFACKEGHTGFYRRVFKATQLAGPITSPNMKTVSVLLGNSTEKKEELFERFPVFRYTQTEARMLFDDVGKGTQHFNVQPSARLALKAA